MNNLIIFDFDDTLVDNSNLDYMGFKIPCQKLGINFPSKLKLKMYRKKNMTAKEIIEIFSDDNHISTKFLQLRKSFLKKESLNYLTIKPYSNLVFQKLLNFNYKLVICTINNNPKMVIRFLKEKEIDKYFEKIYTVNDLGLTLDNSNYSNRILLKNSLLQFIKKNSKNINQFRFIGNSLEDYYAAKNSKIKFIYFLNSYLPKPQINNLIKITTMKGLLNIVKEEKH